MCVNEAGSIRLMEEKDVEQVEELEKQCFSVPWSENILKDGLTGRFDTYLVWEKDGIVAGYCALRVLADEGEIQRIAVLPSWRRHGIAKSLMEAMIQVSKKKGLFRCHWKCGKAIQTPENCMKIMVLSRKQSAKITMKTR